MAALLSSGDVIVDSRLEWARSYWQAGDQGAALDLMRQALADAPHWAAGWFQLGDWCQQSGRRADAVVAWQRCLALDAQDGLGASVKLALLGAVPEPDQLPEAYVTRLFDDYAPRFEAALLDQLDYQVPGQLHQAVCQIVPDDHLFTHVLDLGCGTGLAGQWIRSRAVHLVGVDLSPGMLHEARRKGLYDDLTESDAVTYLAEQNQCFDLILAADVLVYMGDLQPLFRALSDALTPGGVFVASAESAPDGHDFVLTAGHRFAHSAAYLQHVSQTAGLEVRSLDTVICRTEARRDVTGWRIVAGKPMYRHMAVAQPLTGENGTFPESSSTVKALS